jgi:hypothetical protein
MKTMDVVKRYGSKAAVARALGITQNAVVQWGETVPIFRQYQLRELEAKDAARWQTKILTSSFWKTCQTLFQS